MGPVLFRLLMAASRLQHCLVKCVDGSDELSRRTSFQIRVQGLVSWCDGCSCLAPADEASGLGIHQQSSQRGLPALDFFQNRGLDGQANQSMNSFLAAFHSTS